MRRAWLLSLLSVFAVVPAVADVGCGSDVVVSPVDAGRDASPPPPPPPNEGGMPPIDAGGDADAGPACNPTAAFGAPTAYGQLILANADHVFLSHDQLSGWFSSVIVGAPGPNDLFFGTRADTSQSFAPTKSVLSTTDHDENRPSLSADGKVLVYESTGAAGPTQIMVATRTATSGDFTTAALANVDDANFNIDPWLTPDGTLYFSSDRDGGTSHLFAAPPTATPGQWGTPVRVPGIDSVDRDENPVVSDDHLTIFFSRIVSPDTEPDVFTAVRASRSDPFGTPSAVPTLARPNQPDYPTWITPDGCALFVSHRPGVFVAKRGP